MANRLNKDEILRDILRTLISGWGKIEVLSAIEELGDGEGRIRKRGKRAREVGAETPDAAEYVQGLPLGVQKGVIVRFAEEFDEGRVLSRRSDIRRFLESHGVAVKEIKSRNAAFRMIVPVLTKMSEKGLLREINRSRFSGPAQLDDISDAIKGTGAAIRRDERES